MLVQEYITTKCNAHHKNHPANVKLCFYELFGSNLEGDAVDSTKFAICAGVYYYKMQCASQKPSSKCKNMFFTNFLGLIWKGTR